MTDQSPTPPKFLRRLLLILWLPLLSSCTFSEESAILVSDLARGASGIVGQVPGVNTAIINPALGLATSSAIYIARVQAEREATLAQQQAAATQARKYYQKLSPQKRAQVGRRLAVKTTARPDSKGSPIIIYDTKTGRAGNTVYEVSGTPNVGKPIQLGGSKPATYIGQGSTPAFYLR